MKRILKKVCCLIILISLLHVNIYAATLDPTIPTFDSNYMTLSSSGSATFAVPTYTGGWKRFAIQLLRRVSTVSGSTVVYTYKVVGSTKYVSKDETECDVTFPSVGYYQFQIRGENLEGNYGAWMRMSGGEDKDSHYEGVAVTEDDISINGGGIISGDSGYGPGTAQINTLPQGYRYAVVGPNGQILYYTDTNYNNNTNNYNYGPGYNTNGTTTNNQTVTPNTGVSNYPQVPSPYGTGTQTTQNGTTNPNYSTGTTSASPQITQALEVGWHVDNNGRFYYQGNGSVLKGTWYLIDGKYYRFGDTGYLLTNSWFKDTNTGYWYYLAGDGHMLTGWQCLNGTWYYFKPENGNGYGTLYINTATYIPSDGTWNGGYYAFDANGALVRNAWYGGSFYTSYGTRQ